MKLEILPLAQRDVDEAAAYYARHREGLDEEFLAELEVGASAIASDPLRFEQVRPGIRRFILKRFPYSIYYRMPDAETVQITIVKHLRRRPGYGMHRK